MKGLLDGIENSNEADISDYVGQLQQFRPDSATEAPATVVPLKPEAKAKPNAAVQEFLSECHENLDSMDQELLCLEQTPTRRTLCGFCFGSCTPSKWARVSDLATIGTVGRRRGRFAGSATRRRTTCFGERVSALMLAVDKCRELLAARLRRMRRTPTSTWRLSERLNQCPAGTPVKAQSEQAAQNRNCQQSPLQHLFPVKATATNGKSSASTSRRIIGRHHHPRRRRLAR